MCTKVCGSASRTKTCAKTLLVEAYLEANPKLSKPVYVIIDDQSNSSFVDERLVEFFNEKFPVQSYKILSAQRDCSIRTKGFQVTGLRLKGVISGKTLRVPFALSCAGLLDTRCDAATPDTVTAHSHLAQHALQFPEFDPSAHTMVLLGRDCGEVMAATLLSQEEPYLYETPLSLALVGSVCLTGRKHSTVGLNQTKYCRSFCTKVFSFLVNKIKSNKVIANCVHSDQQEPGVLMRVNLVEFPLPITVPMCSILNNVEAAVPGLTPSVVGDSDLFTESAPELSTPASESKDKYTQSRFIANSNKCDENNILNPCFHTLFTLAEPQLTTPVSVQSEYTALSNRHSRGQVCLLERDWTRLSWPVTSVTHDSPSQSPPEVSVH